MFLRKIEEPSSSADSTVYEVWLCMCLGLENRTVRITRVGFQSRSALELKCTHRITRKKPSL